MSFWLVLTWISIAGWCFVYTPDAVGNWTVAAVWSSDRGYYASAYSEMATVEVTVVPTSSPVTTPPNGIPVEYVYAMVTVIAIIVVGIVGILVYAHMKRAKKQR